MFDACSNYDLFVCRTIIPLLNETASKKTIAPWEVPSKFIIFAVSMGATLGIEKQKFAVGQSNPVLLLLFFLYFFASVFPSTFIVPDLLLSLVLFFFISFCFAPNKTILSLLNCLFMFYACLLCTQIPVCWLPGFLIASHFAEKKKKKNTQLLIASTCQDTMLCPLRALPLHSTARSVLPPAKNSNSIKISIYFHARHATLRSSFFPRSSPGKKV